MEHIAAYMMLSKAGKEITIESMKSLFRAIDAPIEVETMDLFLSKMNGKNIEEVMAKGSEVMSSFAVAAQVAPTATTTEVKTTTETKKEPEPEEDFDIFGAF